MILEPVNSIRLHLIDKLKYIFNESTDPKNEPSPDSTDTKTEPSPDSTDAKTEPSPEQISETAEKAYPTTELDELINADAKLNELYNIFKKTKILFIILSDILKFLILQVNDERYKKTEYEKIKFPATLDELILIMGCYGEAFDVDMQGEFLTILDNISFKDLYTISEIPTNMIPFVADDNINLELLSVDYLRFSNDVKNIACNILTLNTDFDDMYFIEV